jgi:hypothetical protein
MNKAMMGQLLNKLNKRTKIFLSIAVVILIVVIIDRLSFSPFPHSSDNMDEELSLKKDLLMKYNVAISMKDSYERKLNELKGSDKTIENKLFQSKTEDLAQAELQEYVKNIARQSGLVISRSSAQKGKIISDDPHLVLVYARVEITNIDRIEKLQDFLYNIEYKREKLLFVDDLKIKGVGIDTTKGVSTIIKLFALAKLEAKT